MKLASRRSGRDGALLVVSRDLQTFVKASPIAPTLQAALDDWESVAPALEDLYGQLNAGKVPSAGPLHAVQLDAPLPRAWQWLDGSAYPQHAVLMAKAFGRPPIDSSAPLMYQGMSHRFLATGDPVPFPDEAGGIDFEGELAIITGEVPMGADAEAARRSIRLVGQINDWSLRVAAATEVKTGFGWIHAKPACSAAPIVVTPEELGPHWKNSRVHAELEVRRGEHIVGRVPTDGMSHGFDDLIVHAARTRMLCAGTIIGSGTVSSKAYREVGSCCISECQAVEMIHDGGAATPFLRYGETVGMTAFVPGESTPLFGSLENRVARPSG